MAIERHLFSFFSEKADKNSYKSSLTNFYGRANDLRLLRTFTGVLGEKIRMRAILKENTANYISLESLINVDFGKKYKLPVSSNTQKKIANNYENDHVSFS